MRIVCIADPHGQHEGLRLPGGDVLIVAGDVTDHGKEDELTNALRWIGSAPFAQKILIGGNHDFILAGLSEDHRRELLEDVIYLEESGVDISGVSFFGAPWVVGGTEWAFQADVARVASLRARLPRVDVLITHAPPFGVRDKLHRSAARTSPNVGCALLADAVSERPPRVHVFGHIHERAGVTRSHSTVSINASVLDHRYRLVRPRGFVFDLMPLSS